MKFGPVRGMDRGPGIFTIPQTSIKDPKSEAKAYLFATSHADGAILVWDTTGQYVTVLEHHNAAITDLVFTPRKFGLIQLMSVDINGALLVSYTFRRTLRFSYYFCLVCKILKYHPKLKKS